MLGERGGGLKKGGNTHLSNEFKSEIKENKDGKKEGNKNIFITKVRSNLERKEIKIIEEEQQEENVKIPAPLLCTG